ncbi:retrovirus-related pol polyprotein from transposon TNT 1-94 [Tanacetum coccineum]|uniref:Retrovirus-related pol polyprotein from transposon TNT 1-94 n=1 Tax=Tanacetum coccineum TaxID=301880 RepID=A0ABQ5BH24_9ASTR
MRHYAWSCETKSSCPGIYAIDVEPVPSQNRKNREVHLDYLKHHKESVGTLREIVEDARVEKPLGSSLASACLYTKHSQELLEYVIGTCPKEFNKRDRKIATAPLNRKKQVTFIEPGVKDVTAASRLKLRRNTKKDKTLPAKSAMKKLQPTRRKFTLGEQYPLTRFTESKVVPAKQPESVSTSKIVITEILSNTSQKPLTRTPTEIGDPTYQTLHIRLFSNAGRTDHPLVFGLKLFKTYDEGSLTAQEFRYTMWKDWDIIFFLLDNFVIQILKLRSENTHVMLKFEKDHLCSACQLGKSQKYSHKPKSKNTNLEVLNTLHMDLCGPMRVQTINGKKYILVIVDDYSRFTWVKFLRSKDETPEFVIKFLKQIQVGLNKTVRYIRTDNGTEFVNQFLTEYYESVGIFHQKSVPRTPQQNDVVERRNRTLVEAARTMLIFSKALMFLWAEAVATACYTQNRSLIHTRHNKTPYELVHDKKPDLKFLCVFGALCYPTNDSEDLGKLRPTTVSVCIQILHG